VAAGSVRDRYDGGATVSHGCARRDEPDPLVSGVAGGVTLLVLATAFSLHALDVSWAWVVYPLGFGGLLPVALGWASRTVATRTEETGTDPGADALERLRSQYATGEIDEVEFERRVEAVLETEAE
jgi:hypothetical protein